MRVATIVKILSALGVVINPATEEKQDDIINALGSIGGGASALSSGRKVVAVTNTALAIGSGVCKTVFITALVGNADVVVFGGSGIIFTEASRKGSVLYPGDKITVSIDNLSKIFINGTINDGISFAYTT